MSRKPGWATWHDAEGAPRAAATVWLGWILAVALVNLGCMLRLTRGVWVLPDDGAYGALAAARDLVRGTPPGAVVAGTVSPLYAVILTPVVAGAARHDAALVLAVTLLGAGLWWWACRIGWRLARRHGPGWAAHAAVVAILISGPVARGFLSGTDQGLCACLALLVWDLWAGAAGKGGWRAWLIPAGASIVLVLGKAPAAWLALVGGSGPPVDPRTAPLQAFPPGALALAVLGILPPAPPGRPGWSHGRLAAAAVDAALLLLLPPHWVERGEWLPLVPVFILLSFSGLARLAEVAPEPWRHPLPRVLAGAWLVTAAAGLNDAVRTMAREGETCAAQPRLMADRLTALGETGFVITSAPGVLGFHTGWRIEDAAPGWARRFDRFKAARSDLKPGYAALSIDDGGQDLAMLRRAGVLRLLWTLPHPRGATAFGLFECHWGPAGLPPAVPGWMVVDEVDCTEPESERTHVYHVTSRTPGAMPAALVEVRRDPVTREPAGDGGWVMGGGERFVISATAGRPLLVLMRTFAPQATSLVPSLNGAVMPPFPVAPDADQFQTILLFSAQGDRVLDRNRIEVTMNRPAGETYASFHYWAMQPATGTTR